MSQQPPDHALIAWRALLAALGEPAWLVCGQRHVVLAINAEALALLGQDEAAWLGQPAEALLATPEDLAFWDEVRDPLRSDAMAPLDSRTRLLDAAGQLLAVSRRICLLGDHAADAADPPRPWLVRVQDRSAEQRDLDVHELQVSELQATLESTADGILVTDMAGGIRAFNRRFAQIWGLPESLLVERRDEQVFDWMCRSVVDTEGYQCRLAQIGDATLLPISERITLHSGQVIERSCRPQIWRDQPCGRVWTFRDLTELVQAGQRIETLASTDALTGLFNRRQMGLAVGDALRQARRSGGTLALLLLDLDRFKQINDSLGQEVGDRVLLDCADRLKSCLRQGDVVARVGGDQFALLIHEASSRGAEAAALRMVAAIAQPCSVDGTQFTLTCSIGVSEFPADGNDAETLLRHAESAMQRAKQGGRSCFRFHQAHQNADMRKRMQLDHAMRQALSSQRFRLHYQPQIDLRSGAVIGAEALIRWRDPELGEISPGHFIPVAEETGFIIAIGNWVLEQAVRQAARWRASGLVMPVSVNVSALQFQQDDFNQRVAAVLHKHQLSSDLLELELTESILVHDADAALLRLSELSASGVKLAIDDFGTGYSSLSYLRRFPIDRLKIDRSFIQRVPADHSDAAIVRAIVQMAQALSMKVIAEGVETETQRQFLRELGCDEFQGFLFAPALDAVSFEAKVCPRLQVQPPPRLRLIGGQSVA